MRFTVPQRLRPYDKVAIVSPASGCAYLFPEVYELGLKRLRTVFDLEPIEFPSARKSPEYLSKNPQARADDINAAFADSSIKAIIATAGGNDCIRILPYLDAKTIIANPKAFLGYSDCTNIHVFLWNLGLISYYGGSVMSQFGMQYAMHDYTISSIKKALFRDSIGQISASLDYTDYDLDWSNPDNLVLKRPLEKAPDWQWHNFNSIITAGRLWGGCLETLDLQFAANQYLPELEDFDDIVMYIETSEELPSAGFVYRFIAALGERGILERIGGMLVGLPKAQFLHVLPSEGKAQYLANQRAAIEQALEDYGCKLPVVFNLNFGHTDPQLLIPNGGIVRIDGIKKTIFFSYQ